MTDNHSSSRYDEIKELIADPKLRIKLYDYVRTRSEVLTADTAEEFFPLNVQINSAEFITRLQRYENASADLIVVMSLLGLWGNQDHQLSISVPVKQLSIQLGKDNLNNFLTSLRLYPLVLLMYALGIGAVTASNYFVLYTFFQSTFNIRSYQFNGTPLVFAIEESFRMARGSFELAPNYKGKFNPMSEYLYNFFKNQLTEVFLLGDEFTDIFDRFEVIYALQHAHEHEKISGNIWGPVGRRVWKYSRGVETSPLSQLRDEASQAKQSWSLLAAGFFDGSFERFEKVAAQYAQELKSFH
jgi:hypothetical protein